MVSYVSIDENKCSGCGLCIPDCVGGHIFMKEGKARIRKDCIACGHCYAICPREAVCMDNTKNPDLSDVILHPTPHALDGATFMQVVKSRRSIRQYKERPVEKDILTKLIEVGRYTATAKNAQGTRFVVIQEELSRFKQMVWEVVAQMVKGPMKDLSPELLAYAFMQRRVQRNEKDDFLFRNAPCVLLIASDWPLDVGLAAQNMEHMALAEGLGCCYNGYLERTCENNSSLKEWVGLGDVTIRGCMLVGYPDVKYVRTVPREKAKVIWR